MDRNEMAAQVAADLFQAEKTTNAAFADQAKLAASLAMAQACGLALKVGAGAVSSVAAAMVRTAGAREDLVAAHDNLELARRALNIFSPDTGGGEKPGNGVSTGAPLRAVA